MESFVHFVWHIIMVPGAELHRKDHYKYKYRWLLPLHYLPQVLRLRLARPEPSFRIICTYLGSGLRANVRSEKHDNVDIENIAESVHSGRDRA